MTELELDLDTSSLSALDRAPTEDLVRATLRKLPSATGQQSLDRVLSVKVVRLLMTGASNRNDLGELADAVSRLKVLLHGCADASLLTRWSHLQEFLKLASDIRKEQDKRNSQRSS